MSVDQLLQQAAQHAADYYAELASKPVAAMGTRVELLASLDKGLPDLGTPAEVVLSQLVRDAEPGILRNAGGRFFGWVMGGSLPVALAADWMTSTWDQNAALYASNPSIALIEEICGRQL